MTTRLETQGLGIRTAGWCAALLAGVCWLAAVPVVVIGAPLGAYICASLSRRVIANALIGLIAIEFVSTLVIIPMSPKVMLTAGLSLAICGLINGAMCRADWYCPKKQSMNTAQVQPV